MAMLIFVLLYMYRYVYKIVSEEIKAQLVVQNYLNLEHFSPGRVFLITILNFIVDCDEWHKMNQSGSPKGFGRYGHTALLVNRYIIIHVHLTLIDLSKPF